MGLRFASWFVKDLSAGLSDTAAPECHSLHAPCWFVILTLWQTLVHVGFICPSSSLPVCSEFCVHLSLSLEIVEHHIEENSNSVCRASLNTINGAWTFLQKCIKLNVLATRDDPMLCLYHQSIYSYCQTNVLPPTRCVIYEHWFWLTQQVVCVCVRVCVSKGQIIWRSNKRWI